MAKAKYYGVRSGRTPGIYFTWDDCKKQVDGYPGAEYKSFKDPKEAMDYVKKEKETEKPAAAKEAVTEVKPQAAQANLPDGPYAFVDGSFNPEQNRYGYGGFLMVNGRSYPLMGSGDNPEAAGMRNVSGEISGAMAAVKMAESLGVKKMTLLYDYEGIEAWPTQSWKAKNDLTRGYREFMNSPERMVEITFQKVKAHDGIEGNEMADAMAKSAVGVPLTKGQRELVNEAMQRGRRDGIVGVSDMIGPEVSGPDFGV